LLDAAPFTLAVYFPDYTVLVLDEKNLGDSKK
jgi:hypothetical protein